MRANTGDKARLQHIYDAILEIESYIGDSSYDIFHSNSMMHFACVKQLKIVGEAANHLTKNFRDLNKEIRWREIIDLRNLLIHEYFGIDTKIIWDIVKNDMPELKKRLAKIIEEWDN